MNERPNFRELLHSRWAAAGAAALALVLAGCGDMISANKASLRDCSIQPYAKASDKFTGSPSQLMSSAEADVLTLQRRVLHSDGSVSLSGSTITATSQSLTLAIPRGDVVGDTDTVTFPIQHGAVQLSTGSVLCSESDGLYTNGTYGVLQTAAKETTGLG